MSPSSWISHLPFQSTFKSSLMPPDSVFVDVTLESCKGTSPRSTLVKWRFDNGVGSEDFKIGSTVSLIMLPMATLMLGHSSATVLFRKPVDSGVQ